MPNESFDADFMIRNDLKSDFDLKSLLVRVVNATLKK